MASDFVLAKGSRSNELYRSGQVIEFVSYCTRHCPALFDLLKLLIGNFRIEVSTDVEFVHLIRIIVLNRGEIGDKVRGR